MINLLYTLVGFLCFACLGQILKARGLLIPHLISYTRELNRSDQILSCNIPKWYIIMSYNLSTFYLLSNNASKSSSSSLFGSDVSSFSAITIF